MTSDRMDGQVRFGVPYDLAGTSIPPIPHYHRATG